MSIRTFNGQWLLAGDGIATSDDCCCDEPSDPPTHPCDCFASWPASLTLDITGLDDYSVSGEGRCNCPADGYAAGLNQTVTLDYEGEITYDGCPGLAGSGGYRFRTYAFIADISVGNVLEPLGVAVYRGSMTNGSCDEYGVEVLVYKSGSDCEAVGIIDKLASGSPSVCDPWVLATLTCNWWQLIGGVFSEDCSTLELYLGTTYFGGSTNPTDPIATGST